MRPPNPRAAGHTVLSMSRVETIGDATLYLGDCVVILPTLDRAVDALVTDPPYSSGGQYRGDRALRQTTAKYVQSGVQAVRPDFSGDNRDQRGFLAWASVWLGMALRASTPGAPCCVFSDWRQLPTTTDAIQSGGWVWRGIVPWDKTGACRPSVGRFAAQCEYVVWGSAGAMPVERGVGCLPGLVSSPVESGKEHITQKPTRMIEDIVQVCAPAGAVLDPFMGSGTTGVACANLGRPFIGIEIEPRYFDIACRRIDAASRQHRLFA